MSILIKGMEMPKEGTVIAIYKLNGKFYASVHGTELCQLCPVPPHGDLIDRDALMKILSKVIDINASIEQRNEATDQERRCLWWFEQQIGIAPTIIPAEEGEA